MWVYRFTYMHSEFTCVLVYVFTYMHAHLESRENPDRLKCSIHVDRIGVHSTFVYIYAGLRVLMIWANCFFLFNLSFLLRKVEDVMTISKSRSLTSVGIKEYTLRVLNKPTTLFLSEQ